jgi:hypothetical protein
MELAQDSVQWLWWTFAFCYQRVSWLLIRVLGSRVPITDAAPSKAWTVFALSNTGIMGSNPSQDMDVCLRLFCVCVVLCIGSFLRRADPPSKESYWLCIGLRNWKSDQGPTKDCRAIDRQDHGYEDGMWMVLAQDHVQPLYVLTLTVVYQPELSNQLGMLFFSLVLQPNSVLGRLHETFRFTSVTRCTSRTVSMTPWTGDQLVARPLPVHKHRKTHTQHKH